MKTGYYLESSKGIITHKIAGISSDNMVVIEDVETLQFSKLTIEEFYAEVILGSSFMIFCGDGYKSQQTKNDIPFVLESVGY